MSEQHTPDADFPYNREWVSIIQDSYNGAETAAITRNDLIAYAAKIGVAQKVASRTFSELANGLKRTLPPAQRKDPREYLISGQHIKAAQDAEIAPDAREQGIRLTALGVSLELVNDRENGDRSKLLQFGPLSIDFFRQYAAVVQEQPE